MHRLWLIFAQTVTVAVAILFVTSTLKPEWLPGRPGPVTVREAPPAAAPATVAATMAPAAAAGNYSAAFRALDEESGAPVAGLPYRMLLPDGRTVRGVTDSDGRTETVSGHDPASVHLFWETSAQTPATEPGGEHD